MTTDHTTTFEYSDPNRYVFTRTDLNSNGDQALVSVKRFDQLGRIRLTQQLEGPDSTIGTDESAGIVVKTQYFYSGANSYKVVSNPFRTSSDPNTPDPTSTADPRMDSHSDCHAGRQIPAPQMRLEFTSLSAVREMRELNVIIMTCSSQ